MREELEAHRRASPSGGFVVLGPLGTHRDAALPRLRAWWEIEEMARASGLPVLALRLAPLVGPTSPLWLRLRSGERPPRGDRVLIQPVAEADVVATFTRIEAGNRRLTVGSRSRVRRSGRSTR